MRFLLAFTLLAASASALADDKTRAVVGGGIGGAVGAAVGEELGDRNGAIIGAGVGAAVGTAVATQNETHSRHAPNPEVVVKVEANGPPAHGIHCPPGQAKKGRC